MCKKNCLFCVNSLSSDAIYGSPILVCLNSPGYEGIKMYVHETEAETCENYKEDKYAYL